MLKQFEKLLADLANFAPKYLLDQFKDISNELFKSIGVMRTSSELLLLHVEDILGYA